MGRHIGPRADSKQELETFVFQDAFGGEGVLRDLVFQDGTMGRHVGTRADSKQELDTFAFKTRSEEKGGRISRASARAASSDLMESFWPE
jgi:hypothetical protein